MQAKYVHENFIDAYVDKAPLVGQASTTYEVEVHNFIVRFTSGNAVAAENMVAHAVESNSCLELMALKNYY